MEIHQNHTYPAGWAFYSSLFPPPVCVGFIKTRRQLPDINNNSAALAGAAPRMRVRGVPGTS